jgi:1-deoxyxylulose-5-phosphate synthase
MRALHEVVQAGKVRHVGVSSMYAWQFAKASTSPRRPAGSGSRRCRTMNNLVYREEAGDDPCSA